MLDKIFKAVIEGCVANPWLVIIINFSLLLVALSYTASNLKINTNTEEMLSEELTWRKYHNEYKTAFPSNIDNLILIVESPKSNNLSLNTRKLVNNLKNTGKFDFVTSIQESDFIRKNGLLYLELEELNKLVPRLVNAQPFLGRLSEKNDFPGVLSLLEDLKRKSSDKNLEEKNLFIHQINRSIDNTLKGFLSPINWNSVVKKGGLNSSNYRIIIAKPKLDYTKLLPGEESVQAIDKIVNELSRETVEPLEVTVTGSTAIAYDELKSVSSGTKMSGFLALMLVLIVLFFAFKSISLILAICANLMAGLIFTATFATFTVGTLNMISIAFAVLYIGLAIDFAIHICMLYTENCARLKKIEAIKNAIFSLRKSLIFCTLTTSIGFFSFIPTAYRGVAELGLISGVGMILSLFLSFTLLPSLLTVLPKPKHSQGARNSHKPYRRVKIEKIIMVGLLAIAFSGLINIKKLHFDNNPINLNNESMPSIQGLKKLETLNFDYNSSISLLIPDLKEAQRFADKLNKNDKIKEVKLITNYIPTNQNKKIDLIEELNLIFGGEIQINNRIRPVDIDEYNRSIIKFLATFEPESKAERSLKENLESLLYQINSSEKKQKKTGLFEMLNKNIFYYFHDFTESISELLSAEKVSVATLPKELKQLWVSEKNQFRIEIFPKEKMNGLGIASFQKLIGEEKYVFSGVPVINQEAGKSVVKAFTQAILTALVIIFAIAYALTKKFSSVLTLLTPLFIANLCVIFFLTTVSFPLNFANIIALPLLLGIGIDSSIHVFHRLKTSINGELFYRTSTAKAVIFSALTTSLSFGSLTFSSHKGTASLGILLMVGLALITIAVLSFIPYIMNMKQYEI